MQNVEYARGGPRRRSKIVTTHNPVLIVGAGAARLTASTLLADVTDPDRQWAKLTKLSPEAAPLVRPDDFVGWRADALPRAPDGDLGAVMRRILARS